jgi:glucose/arabinose dehydrogenase
MTIRPPGGLHLALFVACAGLAPELAAQQAPIGIAPVTLSQPTYDFDTAEQHRVRVTVVARGLNHPFSVALLPEGSALVSERGGALRIVGNAAGPGAGRLQAEPVAGLPKLEPAYRNGGLHDLALHPRFAQNRLVYFTYNKPGDLVPGAAGQPPRQQSRIAVMRGRFDGRSLADVEELFVGGSAGTSGSRLAFGTDGLLYVTTGAPFGPEAQQPGNVYGKVLRLTDAGRPAPGNPFADRADARPEVYTLGHRDQLGLTVHPQTGAVLAAEHGPNGGDEVNLIRSGANYGWPTVTYGHGYDGAALVASPVAAGLQDPLVTWIPSIGPSGLAFYTGDRFPAWQGNLFVGSVRRGQVPRTGGLERVVLNAKLEELRRETLLTGLHQRIRDVRQGPDGLLYLLTDEDDGALLRLEPVP